MPVGVMVAPVIPALNDHEIPAVLASAKSAGAAWADLEILQLPLTVAPISKIGSDDQDTASLCHPLGHAPSAIAAPPVWSGERSVIQARHSSGGSSHATPPRSCFP